MSSDSQTQNLTRVDGNNALTSAPPSKYTPQFSAATQMILERIQSGNSSSLSSMDISTATPPPPGYEDMRRSVLQSMRTTMNMKIPSTPVGGKRSNSKTPRSASASGFSITSTGISAGGSGGKSRAATRSKSKSSGKRKRIKDESDDSDDESDENMSKLGGDSELDDAEEITELPKITQSGRQIVKPTQFVPATYENSSKRRAPSRKVQEQALCKRCGRGHSPHNNLIVFCDGCNLPWHQKCHDPVISDAAVQVETALWFCASCSRKKGIKTGYETTPKGVSWAGKSVEERKAYLDSLSHPQLVSLILQATYLHPDIPLFPSPAFVKTAACLQQPQPTSSTTTSTDGLFSRSEANTSGTINVIRKIQSPASHAPISFSHASSALPSFTTKGREESRESTPASPPYPRAGSGLIAKLGPDDEDLDWLVDSDDFEAFSHAVYENGESHDANMSDISPARGSIGDMNSIQGITVNGMGVGV